MKHYYIVDLNDNPKVIIDQIYEAFYTYKDQGKEVLHITLEGAFKDRVKKLREVHHD